MMYSPHPFFRSSLTHPERAMSGPITVDPLPLKTGDHPHQPGQPSLPEGVEIEKHHLQAIYKFLLDMNFSSANAQVNNVQMLPFSLHSAIALSSSSRTSAVLS